MKKLLVLAVLLVVSACGVKPTGVVSAGPAPTLRSPGGSGRGTDLILYFVIDGRVAPVTRPTGTAVGVSAALSILLSGPSSDEAAEGYATMLPPERGPVALSPGPPAMINVPFPLKPLPPLAVNQLVCTAFAALAAEGSYVVEGVITLSGTDTQLPSLTCQAF
ncbi:hypothetical protein [Amycolatopsis nalaikhensis]|uniref:Lipoprotein n=1 Tax=Amycolatopsis nalaikhensis TaxID=715472 RepID=A0ABY8XAH8_9PSEU|nr:hypothetical protein [Amycolatopsis sp. 2-2]WIV53444.1 hypothetical protein QP939_31670 [Amycolatopsis sp. 2-2]